MENFEKRFGGPDRVAGTDKTTEAYLRLTKAKQILEDQEPLAFEREKTPEEIEIISEIFDRIPDFVKEYGSNQERYTALEQIHILDGDNPQAEATGPFLERDIAGIYLPASGRIEILSQGSNRVGAAHVLVHELMHAQSFFSITLKKDGGGTDQNPLASLRRFGVSINEKGKNEKPLFNFTNEALTEELTKRFCERYFPEIELLKKEFAASKKHDEKKDGPPSTPTASVLGELMRHQPAYSYLNERAGLVSLVELLYERNRDKYATYEDVFKLFSTAMFRGNLLPVAKLIEETLGKGSFREIGRASKERAHDVVDTLSQIKRDEEQRHKTRRDG